MLRSSIRVTRRVVLNLADLDGRRWSVLSSCEELRLWPRMNAECADYLIHRARQALPDGRASVSGSGVRLLTRAVLCWSFRTDSARTGMNGDWSEAYAASKPFSRCSSSLASRSIWSLE